LTHSWPRRTAVPTLSKVSPAVSWPSLEGFCETCSFVATVRVLNFLLRICIPDHLLLDSAPNLGQLISHWEIPKFKNCWYKSARILGVLKLLFQQFLNLSSSQQDMSGAILGHLSNIRWSGGNLVLG
jgi:hypothetical protein